jgi:chemotaxis protein CheX
MITTMSLKDSMLDSAREVFETMAFMALEEVHEEQEKPDLEDVTLLGTITFKGSLEGCLGICCGSRCARTIGANMLGTEPDEVMGDDDMNDAIGEIANMVMGALKARIQDEVGSVEVSIPSVVRGRELRNSLGERASKITAVVNLEGEHNMQFSLLYRETGNP